MPLEDVNECCFNYSNITFRWCTNGKKNYIQQIRLSLDALEKTDSPDLDSEIVFRLELLEMCIKPSMMSNDTLKKYMRKRKRIQP